MEYQLNQIYNMDCLEAMRQFPNNFFDLAIVDPPYGLDMANDMADKSGKQYGVAQAPKRKYERDDWDKQSPDEEYFQELFRISKNQIIWGANHFISKVGIDSPGWVVWYKHTNGYYADAELAWTSFDSTVKVFDFIWNGMLQGDMKNKEVRIHPTQKPVALYKWLLNTYAKPGDLIIDTHMGSGSLPIACHDLGFKCMAFEKKKSYYDDALERINKHKAQLNLFEQIDHVDKANRQMALGEDI